MKKYHQTLFDSEHISVKLFEQLDLIESKKIVSVYGELRLLLYLGILLFTGGVGYFAYENIGGLGHIALMMALFSTIVLGVFYLNKEAKPYTNKKVIVNHIYYDYILLLVSLLCISLITYILVYFEIYDSWVKYSSFMSALLFLFFAYRYDNKGVLSLAITVFSAAIGISISPVDWVQGDWNTSMSLYHIGIIYGSVLIAAGTLSKKLEIKSHFKFSYLNFGFLILYISCLTSIIESDSHNAYAFITLIISSILGFLNWKKKDFLFFLYSSIAFYISSTILLFSLIESIGSDLFVLLFYYLPGSLIAYIVFLVKNKSHFKND